MESRTPSFQDAIIDFLPDATLVISRDGRLLAWNNAMEDLTGVPAVQMLGRGDYEYAIPFYKKRRPILADLVFMPEAELEEKYDTVERIGDTLVVDIFIPDFRPGGIYLWAKASPLYDPEGNIIGAIETIRDISGRKRDEQEIVRSIHLSQLSQRRNLMKWVNSPKVSGGQKMRIYSEKLHWSIP